MLMERVESRTTRNGCTFFVNVSTMKGSKNGVSSWKDITGLEREEALKRGLDENGGWYMKVGGQYVQSRRHLWLPVVFYTDLMLITFTLVTAGYYSVLKHDMEAASECFHFITMVTNMMIITSCLLYYRKVFDDIFVGIGSGFFDYGDTIDPQTKKKMQTYLMDMRTKKMFRFRAFVLVVWVLGISMLIKVVIAYFRFGDTIDGEGGSVSRKHVVAMWFFGIDKWPNYIVMTFICYLAQICVMNSIWGFVLPIICVAEELTGQLYVVGIGLRHTTTRARHIYERRYGEFRDVDRSKYAECLQEALNSSVQHHNIILEVCNGLRTILFVPLMTVMFGTAVLLCMSGFIMVEDSVPIIAKIISLLFIVGEVIYSYLFCLYGENMKSTSEDIGYQLYEDNWRDAIDVFKPYLVMILLRSRRPITLSAGGFMEVNIASFSSVISSSYSYFNLMFTSKP